jgi:hypothetical protein
MKKVTRILMLFLALSVFSAAKNYAQEIVVRSRMVGHGPAVRPMRPSRHHVWVAAEWSANGGTYVYKPGFWALPPRAGAYWIRGRWKHRRGGYAWIPGHWA